MHWHPEPFLNFFFRACWCLQSHAHFSCVCHRMVLYIRADTRFQASFKVRGPELVVNSVYAPHNGIEFEYRESWHNDCIARLLANNNKFQLTLGDWNARLHARKDHESQIGNVTWGRGVDYLDRLPDLETNNRSLFLDTLNCTNSFAMNTFFSKPPGKLVTYKNKTPTDGLPPCWNNIDHAVQ